MNNMRELINLMEGVMAVPGINALDKEREQIEHLMRKYHWSRQEALEYLHYSEYDPTDWEDIGSEFDPKLGESSLDEKSKSEKQARFMAAASHNPEFAKKAGIDQSVAKEFNKADTGTKQLSNAMKHKTNESVPAVDSCQQSNPANADVACAMEGMGERSEEVAQALADFQNMVMNNFADPEVAFDRISANLDPDSVAEFEHALEQEGLMSYGDDDGDDGEPMGSNDFSDDAEALASAGHGSDEDYGSAGDMEFEEALDLQNGYDDINDASGNDYFPNGADGPVVSKVGPSGARQGDNPEQKKMQVAEVHKELVYGYRNYLKESEEAKKKS
jgi:hypothetical protein